jgi:outer membrane lipoprotein SlyB
MAMHMKHAGVVSLAVVVLAGCAARTPLLYGHPDLDRSEEAAAAEDVAACKEIGKAYKTHASGAEVARDTATGGVLGAAGGAVSGAIWGSAGTGAAAGAAGGAAVGLLSNLLFKPWAPKPAYEAAVNQCLADRGYQVVGWH